MTLLITHSSAANICRRQRRLDRGGHRWNVAQLTLHDVAFERVGQT
jgi:hypothetical protein